jgi:ribosome biogenesis GTPase A
MEKSPTKTCGNWLGLFALKRVKKLLFVSANNPNFCKKILKEFFNLEDENIFKYSDMLSISKKSSAIEPVVSYEADLKKALQRIINKAKNEIVLVFMKGDI